MLTDCFNVIDIFSYCSLKLEPILVLTLIGAGLAESGLNQIGGRRPSRSDGKLAKHSAANDPHTVPLSVVYVY